MQDGQFVAKLDSHSHDQTHETVFVDCPFVLQVFRNQLILGILFFWFCPIAVVSIALFRVPINKEEMSDVPNYSRGSLAARPLFFCTFQGAV